MYLILTCILLFNKTITLYFLPMYKSLLVIELTLIWTRTKVYKYPPPPPTYKYDKVWIGNKIWNMTPLFNTSKAINTLVCAALKSEDSKTKEQCKWSTEVLWRRTVGHLCIGAMVKVVSWDPRKTSNYCQKENKRDICNWIGPIS